MLEETADDREILTERDAIGTHEVIRVRNLTKLLHAAEIPGDVVGQVTYDILGGWGDRRTERGC